MSPRVLVTARSLSLVWAAAAGWTALLRSTGDLRRSDGSFDGLLAAGGAWLLLGCAGWGTVAVAGVLLEACTRGGVRVPRVVCPARLRRPVLAAVGLALTSGVATTPAALATDTGGTSGATTTLPVPARSVGPAAGGHRAAARVVVRRGDTLWAIVSAHLPPGASVVDVADHVRRIHAANRGVIGPDPDHLEPGQHLRLPASPDPTSEENP